MFINTEKVKKILTIQANIFDDSRVSLGAKGLFTQIYYCNKDISTLNDLLKYINNTEEELKALFEELVTTGYIVKTKTGFKLVTSVSNKDKQGIENVEEVIKEANEYAEQTQPKALSIFDKIKLIIDSYNTVDETKIAPAVKNLLLIYFEQRLAKTGRFSEAGDLHANQVRAMIGELVSFHLSEDQELECIQTAIDKQWFKFVKPTPKPTFDKTKIKSGTYSEADVEKLKKKAKLLEQNGEQGVF